MLPSERGDAAKLAPIMRWHDREEIACFDHNPREALERGLDSFYCLTAWDLHKEVPLCMFGVDTHPALPYVGSVWMLGSRHLDGASVPFIRQSRRWLSFLSEDFQWVSNVVMARNTLHVRWLRWLGVTFNDKPIYVKGEKFLQFYYKCVNRQPSP